MAQQGIGILSIDAKDIWLSKQENSNNKSGYGIRNADGSIKRLKFSSMLDFSLESQELQEVFHQTYPNGNFIIRENEKDYTVSIINLTFHYSVKKFNSFGGGLYVRYDIPSEEVTLQDGVYLKDGELCAVKVNEPVKIPLEESVLTPCFRYDAATSAYQANSYMPTIVTVAQLRRELYENGFQCDGRRYVRYKRSAGSSRVGKCLFVDERLYPALHEWEKSGLRIEENQEIDLAALESYISLPLSSMIGTLEIMPENILVIDDEHSQFRDNAVAVTLENGHLTAEEKEIPIDNNIFDGQSLIDPSLMGAYRRQGFVLLRNRMFKSACFNCNIQKWFRDNGITDVSQLHGRTRAKWISQILLITTPSSIKYLKFGSLEDWLDTLEPAFGVVKYDKPTHFFDGRLVQLHYQLLNTLHLKQEEIDTVMRPSLEYLKKLKTDPAVFRCHVGMNRGIEWEDTPILTKNGIVYKLLGINEAFTNTKLYHDFRTEALKAYTRNLRCGHILVNGNYSTLCGNPIEMLQSAIGTFDGESKLGKGTVYSKRFAPGQEILGCRSPHITMGNLWIATNLPNLEIDRYLNLTDTIVCVNSIGENLLSRLSGCDFDSDSVLLTDEPILLQAAKKNYGSFAVPTSCVPAKKITRRYNPAEKAELDTRTSVNRIGEIVNLSQELNSLFWDRVNSGIPISDLRPLYYDISILDVLSNIEIDKAKREYAIDSGAELKRIKMKYRESDGKGREIKPNFFGFLAKSKGYYDNKRKKYAFRKTSMDYLQHTLNRYRSPILKEDLLPFSSTLKSANPDCTKVNYRQVNRVLAAVKENKKEIQAVWSLDDAEMDREKKYFITQELQKTMVCRIAELRMNPSTMYRLLKAMEEEENRDISRNLFYTLFGTANASFYELIQKSVQPVSLLEPFSEGQIELFGIRFRQKKLGTKNRKILS